MVKFSISLSLNLKEKYFRKGFFLKIYRLIEASVIVTITSQYYKQEYYVSTWWLLQQCIHIECYTKTFIKSCKCETPMMYVPISSRWFERVRLFRGRFTEIVLKWACNSASRISYCNALPILLASNVYIFFILCKI